MNILLNPVFTANPPAASLESVAAGIDSLKAMVSGKGSLSLELYATVITFVMGMVLLYMLYRLLAKKQDEMSEYIEVIHSKLVPGQHSNRTSDNKDLQGIQAQLIAIQDRMNKPDPQGTQDIGLLKENLAALQNAVVDIRAKVGQLILPDLSPLASRIDRLETMLKQALAGDKPVNPPQPVSGELSKPEPVNPKPSGSSLEAVQQLLLEVFEQWKLKGSTESYFHKEAASDKGRLVVVAPMLNAVPFDRMEPVLKNRFDKDEYFDVVKEQGPAPGIVKQVDAPAVVLIEFNNLPRRIRKGKYTKYVR